MKMLKTLALAAVAVGFMSAGAFAADATSSSCDIVAEMAMLQKAHDAMMAKGDDSSKAKAAQVAQQMAAIKKEADKSKACKMAEECKKACGISN